MKKGVIFFVLIILMSFLVRADLFGIEWGFSEGELSVGGGIPGAGEIPEEEEEEEGEEGGGGGGGGETVTPTVDEGFEIEPSPIIIKITRGEPLRKMITITNIGKTELNLNLSLKSVTRYVFLDEKEFTLKSGEVKRIILTIYIPTSEEKNSINGKMIIQSKNETKEVDIVLDIRDRRALFDIRTTLLKKILFQGQRAFADIEVLNLGDLKNIDVALELSLIDENKTVYDIKKEMFAINDSYDGKFFLTVPRNLDLGKYTFHSKVSYEDVTAESYDTFEVIQFFINFAIIVFYLITAIVLVLITLVSIIITRKIKKK
jgi:hypothetical protein